MCIREYKGIYRGAFALVISYLEATTLNSNSREDLKSHVSKYLNDNGILADFTKAPHSGIVTRIVRAGESVYFDNKSMDEALARLSRGLKIYL